MRSNYAALAVGNENYSVYIRVLEVIFKDWIGQASLSGLEAKGSLENTFDDVAKEAIGAVMDAKDRATECSGQKLKILVEDGLTNRDPVNIDPSFLANLRARCDTRREVRWIDLQRRTMKDLPEQERMCPGKEADNDDNKDQREQEDKDERGLKRAPETKPNERKYCPAEEIELVHRSCRPNRV